MEHIDVCHNYSIPDRIVIVSVSRILFKNCLDFLCYFHAIQPLRMCSDDGCSFAAETSDFIPVV